MLIYVEDLWKTYGEGASKVDAIRGITMHIEKGSFTTILGPSGCGKSSLLHILGAMDKPTSGKVILENRDMSKLDKELLCKIRLKRIGFVFQTFNLLPTLTAVENVMLPMRLSGVDKEKARKKALDLLDVVGIRDRADHLPQKMSGGQRQRVAIARSIANDPAMILADEPTGNLDSESGSIVMDILRELNSWGVTIVMVTHNSELAKLTSHVIQMKDGQIIAAYRFY